MNLRRTPTIARKENRCGIAACNAEQGPPIARLPPSAKGVRRKSGVLRLLIADCSFTGMNQPDKRRGPWPAHPLMNVRDEPAIRSKLCSPNSSSNEHQRVRLRRLWNVSEQFLLAATAQNLKRLVRFLAQRPPKLEPQVS